MGSNLSAAKKSGRNESVFFFLVFSVKHQCLCLLIRFSEPSNKRVTTNQCTPSAGPESAHMGRFVSGRASGITFLPNQTGR